MRDSVLTIKGNGKSLKRRESSGNKRRLMMTENKTVTRRLKIKQFFPVLNPFTECIFPVRSSVTRKNHQMTVKVAQK